VRTTCSFRAVFGLPTWNVTVAVSARLRRAPRNLYRCRSTYTHLNYCHGIFFKPLSYLYEVVRTNFSADFWTFRNFWPQFSENCGATYRLMWELCNASERGIICEKNCCKPRGLRTTNSNEKLVRTMHPLYAR